MININENKVVIDIYVQPGAKNTIAVGLHDNRPKIKIAAEPTDGKANKEVIKFFAELLNLKQKDIEIISGDKSRIKRLAVFDISQETIYTLQGLYK